MLIRISDKYGKGNTKAVFPRYSEDSIQKDFYKKIRFEESYIQDKANSLFKERDFMFRWVERDEKGFIIGSAPGGIEPLEKLEEKIIATSVELLERILPGEILLPQEASRYLATFCNYIMGKYAFLELDLRDRVTDFFFKEQEPNLASLIKKNKMRKPILLNGAVRPLRYYESNAADCAAKLFEMVNLFPAEELNLNEVASPLMQIYEYVYDKWKIGERKLFGKKRFA